MLSGICLKKEKGFPYLCENSAVRRVRTRADLKNRTSRKKSKILSKNLLISSILLLSNRENVQYCKTNR